MNKKLLFAQVLFLGLTCSALQAHDDYRTWTTGTGTAAVTSPKCRSVEKYKFVEKPRQQAVKEKTVMKNCCQVEKYIRKVKNGVVVKDRPVSRNRHCWKCHRS